MQKAYSLQPDEMRQASQLEEEQKTLLARYGALEIDRKNIRKRLPQIEEQQRGLIRNIVQRLGIQQFNAARVDGNNVIVDTPDQPALVPPAADVVPLRTNGSIDVQKGE